MYSFLKTRPSTAPPTSTARPSEATIPDFTTRSSNARNSMGGRSETNFRCESRVKIGKERTFLRKRSKKHHHQRPKNLPRADLRKEEEQNLQDMAYAQRINYLVAHTHFNKQEVEALVALFQNMVKKSRVQGDFMDRPLFRETVKSLFGITDNVMMDQMYYFFDADHEGSISCTEWILNMSILMRGTLEEHIRYCFSVYDINSDGGIGTEEIMVLLSGSLHPIPGAKTTDEEGIHLDSEGVRDLAHMVLHAMDLEKSGQITLKNFRKGCIKNPLLMQSLGECLPKAGHLKAFSALFAEDYSNYATNYSLPDDPDYIYINGNRPSIPTLVAAKVALEKSKQVTAKVRKILHQGGPTDQFRNSVREILTSHRRALTHAAVRKRWNPAKTTVVLKTTVGKSDTNLKV